MTSLLLAFSLASAGGLPSIDEALRTGATASADTAVVIGVEDYAFVQDVPYAQRDAASFYDLLVYSVGVPSSRVRLLDQGASKEQILEAVTDAGNDVGAGGSVWIYFAGHGAADPSTGGRMLLGDDVKQDSAAFASRGVPVDQLKDLASAKGGAVNLIVDACYSGLGRGGDELVAGMRFLVPAYATAAKPGSLEWSAASGDQLSGPLHPARHGAFTYLAVGAMRGWADGQLDGTRDGQVTAEEAQLYVKEALRTLQITDQTPELTVEDGKSRTLIRSDKLEEAPELDARLAVGGAPDTGPAPYKRPAEALDATDRPTVDAMVRGAIEKCVGEHAQNDPVFNQWTLRFKVKAGKMKGYMASAREYSEAPHAFPTYSCVREEVRSWSWVSGPTVKFRTAVTLETSAPPAAPTPAPQPAPQPATQPAPAATAVPTTNAGTSATSSVNIGGLEISTSVNIDETGLGAAPAMPATPTAAAPAAATSEVSVVFRSQDGEWVDVKINGETVCEIRNDDEESISLKPGVYTVEFFDFMEDEAYARGKLDTTGQSEIVFGVRETSVELYGAGSWQQQ